ncbi:MAG: hypothetical protein ACE5RJ_00155 [Nitrosopumilaceae archaeon]
MAILILMPVYANAQSSDRITLLENFGSHDRGEELFIFGNLAQVLPDSYLILQIINPNGDICQIQQLTPLSNGLFLTEAIPLKGRICGITGEFEIRIFYGEYSTTSSFSVSFQNFQEPTDTQLFDSATQLVRDKIESVQEKTNISTLVYTERLNASTDSITELESIYIDLWSDLFIDDAIYDVNPAVRPAIESSLDSTAELIESGKLSFEIAKDIDRETFAAIFYYEIGDTRTAIQRLNDVFVSIKNVDPIKAPSKPVQTYEELEDTLLNLMLKTGSIMNKPVKEEIAFIFARGTAPIYATELSDMLDLLSESRYLDIISRKDNQLYRLIQSEWESTRSSLENKESIEDLLELKEKVNNLYQAALLLRDLDNVDRFISSDKKENSELANLIAPEWDSLASNLELATSVQNIIDSEKEIKDMKNVIDVSARISKAVEISQTSNINSGLADGWEALLIKVQDAQSVDEILSIVSEFDQSINELREKRSPISILKFEYETMKSKAELQADHKNLFMINNALKILDTARQMEEGNPSVSRIDRIEVLLTWVSETAPSIKADLNSYTKDAYKVRAADILQRAKSIENLVDLSLTKNRFLPGYTDFTDKMHDKIDDVRSRVIANDLDSADNMVRDLFSEWREVSSEYADDPYGSDVGYDRAEIKRIDYREKLESLSNAVSNFYNADFAPYADGYNKLAEDAYELVDYGNFVDADSKLQEIGNYLREYLALKNDRIIYDISYDPEKEIWIMSGYVDNPTDDHRENLYLTVYDMNGDIHSTLKFTDTREGAFFTQWGAPAEPGLYVVMLQYQNVKASQLVYIEDKSDRDFNQDDLDIVELAREYEELESFIERFGGANYDNPKFQETLNAIEIGLAERDTETVDDKLSDLKRLIERYLPVRSRAAIIEAQFEDQTLYLSGAVQKTLSFSEDLYVDIFDQKGNHIEEIALKDSSAGRFNEIIKKSFEPGTYVAQLQYHDLVVTDFFNVYG